MPKLLTRWQRTCFVHSEAKDSIKYVLVQPYTAADHSFDRFDLVCTEKSVILGNEKLFPLLSQLLQLSGIAI